MEEVGTIAEPPVTPASPERTGKRSTEHWLVLAVALSGLALLAVFALWIEPDPRGFGTHERLGLPACTFLEWTGFPCPGCGVTTSVDLAARGRILDSIRNQPFGFLVALALPAVALWALVGHLRGRDLYRDLNAIKLGRLGIAAAALLFACWVYKTAIVRGWIG